ncbi:MAG: transporter [Actinomycetota bacterium]|nr:transporter [Actinomycetota bacterium]
MPQMVPDDLLPNMNGALRTVQEGTRLIAPLLGAGAFTAFGMTPIVVADALTFSFAAVLTGMIRLDEAKPERGDLDFWSDATTGVRHIAGVTVLRQVVFSTAVALLSIGFAEAIIFPVVEHGLDRPPMFIGVLVSVQGVGAVLGGITATMAVKRFGEPRTTGFGMAAFAIGTGLLIPPCLPVVVIGMAVLGFGVPWLVVGLMTLVQRRTPIAVLGRVATAVEMLVGVPQVISIAVGAALVTVIDYRILIGTIATVPRPREDPRACLGGVSEGEIDRIYMVVGPFRATTGCVTRKGPMTSTCGPASIMCRRTGSGCPAPCGAPCPSRSVRDGDRLVERYLVSGDHVDRDFT